AEKGDQRPVDCGGAGKGSGERRRGVEADYESEYEVGPHHGDRPGAGGNSRRAGQRGNQSGITERQRLCGGDPKKGCGPDQLTRLGSCTSVIKSPALSFGLSCPKWAYNTTINRI